MDLSFVSPRGLLPAATRWASGLGQTVAWFFIIAGIAIGGGTDVAIESAGLILIKDNPMDVGKAIALSKASHKKMIQNLWWAQPGTTLLRCCWQPAH